MSGDAPLVKFATQVNMTRVAQPLAIYRESRQYLCKVVNKKLFY
jgi:hypothetical protein